MSTQKNTSPKYKVTCQTSRDTYYIQYFHDLASANDRASTIANAEYDENYLVTVESVFKILNSTNSVVLSKYLRDNNPETIHRHHWDLSQKETKHYIDREYVDATDTSYDLDRFTRNIRILTKPL